MGLEPHLHLDRSALEGTHYVEFVPGRYRGEHWSPDACFIHGDTIGLIEPILKRRIHGFDRYGMVEVPKETWRLILGELRTMRAEQPGISKLIQDLEAWIDWTLKRHDIISILGI